MRLHTFWFILTFGTAVVCHAGSPEPAPTPNVGFATILQQKVKSPPKAVVVRDADGTAVLEGRWRNVGPKKYLFTTPTINTVYIECAKGVGRCTETIAFISSDFLDSRRGGFADGELGSITHEYQIIEWSAEKIVATKAMPVAVLELRIFPREQSADRIYSERADPTVFSRYVLE